MKYLLLQGLRWCMLLMAVSASAQISTPVANSQLPTGGKVVTGTASIQSVGNVLNINQSSQRSAINWNTFNVGSGAKVNFIQPSASSVTLNRVLDTNGSQILGSISANGQVFISNPNGVLFGPNSQVNVGGLIATTQNISVDDFMAGKSTFEGTGAAGAVVNQGTLEAALGGYIALLAPSVRNEGVVLAREGTVAFAASDKTVVQFNGPKLVTVMVDKPVLDALVENKQMVRADGGLVIFSARSANAVLSSVIRNTGTVQANTIVNKQGRIMLEGGTQGVVEVGGTLQASGIDTGTQGGTISATGDKVSVVSGALLEATGQAGGGNVLVGGGWQGSDPTIQSANAVNIASGAVLNASAIQNGKGGTVVAWSDTQNSAGVTKVQGTLLARGGAEGGDGGRIETSGRWISTGGASGDASAAKGNGGQWLFDPYDVDIISTPGVTNQATNTANTWSPVGNSSTILNSDVTSLLNAGTSVTVLVPTTGGGGLSGNIKVSAPIIQQAASPSANLTLSAYRNLLIDQPITLSGSTGTLQLTAGTGSSALGYISIDNAITANTVSVDNFASGPVTQSFPISANNLRISAPLSNVTLNDTSNQIGALAANVQSLSIKTNQGVDRGSLYGSGMAVGVVGDLTGVTATGDIAMSVMNGNLFVDKSITTTSTTTTALKLNAGASLNTGAYSGSNSVNNPYGPNIILANNFTSTGQTISVGSGGTGLLYTGGYGNSGVSLAGHLGANKSRYNSNEGTTNFSTAVGSGLTAIYRQNPSMVVTGPSASTTYGTAAVFGTNSISGLANSDTSAGMVFGTYSYASNLSTSGNQKAGSYSVVPSGASNGLGYGISYTNGTYSVAQKALTYVSGILANNKTYDGNSVATIDTSNVVISGNITNDVITGGSAQGAFANANAGIAKVVTLSNPVLYGSDAANYSVNLSQLTTNATINQAPAVVTAGSLTTTYSGTTQFILGSNFTATGLVGGETKSVLTGVSASGSGLNAGTYATTASGTDTNYSLTFVPGSLVINPAPLTVTANSRSKTYGDTMTFAGTEFTTSGLQNGQTATSASFTTSGAAATAATSGSPYTITPSALTGGTFNSSNYAITYVNGALTVNRAPLTITANSFTKTYGDAITLTGNEFSTSGLRNSDTTTTATLTTTGAVATAPYSSTPYSITPSAVAGANGFNTTNYSITYVNGGINVSKAPLSVTANSYTKTYGDLMTFSGTEFSSSGLKNSETATNATLISSGSSALASYSSSPYAITPSALAGGTFNANNYSITYNAGNLTVNRAPLTVTANSYTKTYGETKSFAGSEFSTSGFKNNETATTATLTSLGGVSTAAHSITPYPITPSALSGGTFSSNNYNITYSNGGLTVNKANATVIGLSGSTNFDGTTKTLTGFTATGLVNGDILNGVSASTSGRFSGTYLNTPIGTASNYNLNFVSGQLVITGCPGGPPCTAIGPQTTASNITPVVMPATTTPSFASAVLSTTSPTSSAAPVVAFTSSSSGGSLGSGGGTLTLANSNAPTNSVNTVNVISSGNTTTSPSPATSTTTTTIVNAGANPANPAANAVNIATNSPTASPTTSQINAAQGNAIPTANPNTISTATQPNNVVTPQRLADILSKKDPVEIATALPPNQVAQLSPEQVAPLVNSLNLRQLMSLTNEQVAKFEPVRQAELLNIIKVLKDNPEKAAEKAFTPTDKTFAQLAANGLLKEQLDTLSTRITQINQNRTTVNIDTPQKLAELLTKKDPIEIATALPSNQVAQLTPEQAAPLINSLTVRQLMALTNEQISKLDPARQAELLNIINVIKNNPEKAADKAYTAIDKTTAQYVANGLMKEQIDALASRVTQITQSKTTTNIDTPQKLAEILNKNNPVEIASSIPSNIVPQLSSDQVAPLINALSVKQLLSLTNEQMSKLDPTRLAELINILKGLKDNPEKATDKTYTPEDAAVAKYAATGLLKDPIERFSLRANYIADNKFKDPLSKELADLTNPPVPTNVPVARNAPNQANRPLNAAQLAAQNANRETPNLTPAQVAALDPKDLGPLLSQLNANQLLAVTNAQMAGLENAYLNQLTVLLNFVQDRATNPVANAGPATPGNRINNTNIFINQPVAKLAGAALLADQPNVAPLTPPIPASTATLASVSLTPKQVSELDPSQLAALINQLNANQLMAITDAQMARMDGRALNQLTILMNFVQQRTASNNGPANGNNPASGGNTANINVFVNQPVSRLASNALLNEQPKSNEPVGNQSFAQTNITVNLTPRQVSELDPTQLSPLISQLNANQLMAITNTQMARLDTQSINQLNILMNFVQQRALNSNTTTTIYINQPVSRIAAASLMNEQPLPSQLAGAAPTPITTVPLSPQQIANLTPNQIAPLLNRMNSRQLLAVTDTQMANLDSSNLNQLITLLNFIQDSARTSPVVTNNFATRPVAGFLPPELNANQFLNQP